jgi:predicted ATPase
MITKISARGYKSLQDVSVDLAPLSVVVGPNNAGKSNFFDLLQLVSGFASGPLDKAFEKHRGDPIEAFSDPHNPRIEVSLEIDLTSQYVKESRLTHGFRAPLRYALTVSFDRERALFRVEGEELDWLEGTKSPRKNPFIGRDEERTHRRVTREGGGGHPRLFPLHDTRTVLSQVDDRELYPTIYAVQQYFRSWRFYQFSPNALRQRSPQLAVLDPGLDGSALSGVLDTLQRDYPEQFNAVRRELIAAIPEVEDLSIVDTGDRGRLLQVDLAGDRGFSGRVVSDGVLRILAMLVLAYSPQPGGLVCFEEPENGIHPARLGFVVAQLRGIARARPGGPRCQVLVNSHSPYLVDHLAPEELVLATVDSHLGTKLRRLRLDLSAPLAQHAVKRLLETGEATLGDMWYGGQLDA